MCTGKPRSADSSQKSDDSDVPTPTEVDNSKRPNLWGGDFPKFYAARILALAGSVITSVALPLLILSSNGSYFYTAAVTAAATVPYLLFGLIAGALADRYSRKRMIVSSQVIAASSLASIPATSAFGYSPSPGHVLAVAFISGTCFVFFDAACFGALPAIVDRKNLVTANSALWTSGSLIDVSLPAVAGLIVATVGAAVTVGIEAAMLIVAAGIFVCLRTPLDAEITAKRRHPTFRQDIANGLSFICSNPLLKSLTLLGAGSSVVNGTIGGLMAVTTQTLFNISPDDPRTGLTWAAVAVGAASAAASLPFIRRHVAVGRITTYAISTYPMVLLALVYIPWVPGKFFALTLWGTAVSLVILNGITIRQELTPLNLQSRVNTTGRMVAWGGTPLGAVGGGVAASAYSPATAICTAAALAAALTVAVWLSVLPQYKESA